MKSIKMFDRDLSIKNSINELSLDEAEKILSNIGVILTDNQDIDRLLDLTSIISDITEAEKDIITFEELKTLIQQIEPIKLIDNLTFINEFIVDGKIYKTSAKDNKFGFSAVEVSYLKKNIKFDNPINIHSIIAGILFRPVDENGQIKSLRNDNELESRIELFRNKMTIEYIYPYLNEYQKLLVNVG